MQTGTADGGEMTGSKANFEMLRSFNDNGEVTGNVVTTYSVANLGYGYIGLNADTMNVAGEPGSDASKNLRKGFATVLAVYRDTAFDSYYGDANNPMKLEVYELSKESIMNEDSVYYTNVDLTQFLSADARPIASRLFTPKDYNVPTITQNNWQICFKDKTQSLPCLLKNH